MTFKSYTGFQYLLIDAANNFGPDQNAGDNISLDKKIFEDRIQWALDNLGQLEQLASQADSKPLYIKAVMAIRKAQKHLPTGHIVAMDASCSG